MPVEPYGNIPSKAGAAVLPSWSLQCNTTNRQDMSLSNTRQYTYWRVQSKQTSLRAGKVGEGSFELVALRWESGRPAGKKVEPGWFGEGNKRVGKHSGRPGEQPALHQGPQIPVTISSILLN